LQTKPATGRRFNKFPFFQPLVFVNFAHQKTAATRIPPVCHLTSPGNFMLLVQQFLSTLMSIDFKIV
jgi:hypothetical protein